MTTNAGFSNGFERDRGEEEDEEEEEEEETFLIIIIIIIIVLVRSIDRSIDVIKYTRNCTYSFIFYLR